MANIFENQDQVQEAEEKEALQEPPFYKVVLNNDDYTPMDFVVEILCMFFSMNQNEATGTMLKIHNEGKAVCGIYPRDIAETKCDLTNRFSREKEYPLLCSVERA
tara:strand:- start:770 stop:1084 length:315 start_codon:yes stop_codon:yes gene_type:complete